MTIIIILPVVSWRGIWSNLSASHWNTGEPDRFMLELLALLNNL